MKKNAILINRLSDGGSERVASNISLNLPDSIEQYLFIIMTERVSYGHKCNIFDLNHKPSKDPFRRLKNLIKKFILIYKIKSLKKKLSITSTISFGHYYNIYNILSRQKDKVILTIHTLPSIHKTFQGFFAKKFVKHFYNYADVIVVVSNYIKYDLMKYFNIDENRIKVIHNPFNIKDIEFKSHEKLEDIYLNLFKSDIILSVGRISPEKGQEFLIKAFSQISKNTPNSKLVLLGYVSDDNYKEKLNTLIGDLNLSEKVNFIDFHTNPYKFIKRSKFIVVSSIYEGFSNVIVESMSCKIPVISVDCKAGPREIISPSSDIHSTAKNIEYCEYGILTPSFQLNKNNDSQIKHLGMAIYNLLTNSKLYNKYSEMSRFRAMDFNIDKIINKYEDIII